MLPYLLEIFLVFPMASRNFVRICILAHVLAAFEDSFISSSGKEKLLCGFHDEAMLRYGEDKEAEDDHYNFSHSTKIT